MRVAVLLVALLGVSAVLADRPKPCSRLPDVARTACEHFTEALGTHFHTKSAPEDAKRRLLTYNPGQALGTVQDFFANIMGQNYSDYLPSAWSNPNFNWDKLGTFDYSSNMQYFIDAIYLKNITAPKTLAEVHDNLEKVTAIFCTPETFTPGEKVFSTCVGPKVVLEYAPKVCVLEEDTQQVVCDPAKIMLSLLPGGCTKKYVSPSVWKAKECKISGSVGFSKEVVYGGNAWGVPLTTIDISYDP